MFRDRAAAGRALAARLSEYADVPRLLVLGLPRGGVPVAAEVARLLHAELGVCLVRKLGVPGRPELAMGAVALGGVTVVNEDVRSWCAVTDDELEAVIAFEQVELERRRAAYLEGPAPLVADATVIVVDDGLATGSTMRAACQAVRLQAPERLVAAVPVAPHGAADALRDVADHVVVARTPRPFRAVGEWYDDFAQTTDDEVRALLGAAP